MADVSFILDEAEATIRRIADSSANGFSDMDGLILEAERLRDVSIVADLLPSNGGEVLLHAFIRPWRTRNYYKTIMIAAEEGHVSLFRKSNFRYCYRFSSVFRI